MIRGAIINGPGMSDFVSAFWMRRDNLSEISLSAVNKEGVAG